MQRQVEPQTACRECHILRRRKGLWKRVAARKSLVRIRQAARGIRNAYLIAERRRADKTNLIVDLRRVVKNAVRCADGFLAVSTPIDHQADARGKVSSVLESVRAGQAGMAMEGLACRAVAEGCAPLVRQEIGELEVAAAPVAVPLRKERLPAQAGVQGEAAVHAPGVLHIQTEIILAIVLPLRIRLRKGAHLPQQKIRQAVAGVRAIERELPVRRIVARRIELQVDIVHSHSKSGAHRGSGPRLPPPGTWW